MGIYAQVKRMVITLKHTSGVTKRVKLGFSWTFFFFGLWVPLFRADFKNFFRIWGLGIVTIGIYYLVSCWTYNKIHTKDLLEKGYQPIDEQTRQVLVQRQIIADHPIPQGFAAV